ncbi:MAG: hypothetical protein AAF696_08310, partial [Bacteroidota bacterium]
APTVGDGKADKHHLSGTWVMGDWQEGENSSQQRQLLLGLEGQLHLLQDKLQLKGEWVHAYQPTAINKNSAAWSIQSRLQIFNGQTQLIGNYDKLNPGYFSITAPLLLQESERYHLEISQSLFKNSLTIRAYAKQSSNPLLPFSFQVATIRSQGFNLRYQADKLPYFQIDYAPYYQDFGLADTSIQENDGGPANSVFTAQTGYAYTWGSCQLQTTLSFSRQLGSQAGENNFFSSSLLNWNQVLQFASNWGLNASGTFIHSQYAQEWDKTWTGELSAFVRLRSGLYSSLGVNYLQEEGEKGILRQGLFLDNSIPITKSIQAQLRLEYSHNENYRPDIPYYQEYLIRGGITYSW